MTKILRAASYIRVSTAEQALHGYSLQAQKEYLESYASTHGMRIVASFADEGQTARKELKKRKAIRELLQSVEQEEIDVILFWKMDRWFRNVSDFYKVQDVLDAHDVRWIAVAEPNMNLDTREGRLNLNIMLSIGQNEVDTTSERIRFTVDSMIKNGRLVWGDKNLPLGYHIEDKKIVKTEEEAPIVEEFFRYIKTHRAKRQTMLHIQEMFHIPFSYSQLRTMLSSDFYAGKYRDNYNYCPAYLSYNELLEIREALNHNIKAAPSGRVYLFTGLLRCPRCGTKMVSRASQMTVSRKTGAKRTYNYYICSKALLSNSCTYTHWVSQILLEKYLLDNLAAEYAAFQVRCSSVSENKKTAAKKQRSPEKIKSEMERLNQIFQLGRIEFDDYNQKYVKLERELEEVAEAETVKINKQYPKVEKVLSEDFRGMYDSLTLENRRAFWHSIIKEICIDENKQVSEVIFL